MVRASSRMDRMDEKCAESSPKFRFLLVVAQRGNVVVFTGYPNVTN